MSAPLAFIRVLTESWEFDIMHRRAGREARPQREANAHLDAHKNCPLGRCGTRPGGYHTGQSGAISQRSRKITAWRKKKAKTEWSYLIRGGSYDYKKGRESPT